MQSDPQDEQGPVAGSNEAVEPGQSSGPRSSSPPDAGPGDPLPDGELPGSESAPAPPPPQMPAAPSGYVAPPQMPGEPGPSWDGPTRSAAASTGGQSSDPVAADTLPRDPAQVPPAPRIGTPTAEVETPTVLHGDAPAPDWIGRICPYLSSHDGSYGATQPDERHRCTAQEPFGTLPLAFQERYCLTDKHVRCEMYKYAQETRAVPATDPGVAADRSGDAAARARPALGTVSAALRARAGAARRASGTRDGDTRRPAIVALVALGLLILLVVATLLLSGGGGNQAGPGASPSSAPGATGEPAAETPTPTPEPTPEPAETPAPDVTAGPTAPSASGRQNISYQVQEGEALRKIAESFGTTRQRIIRANEGMADKSPYVVPGDVIIVPASGALTVEELETFPGYLGPAE